MATRRSHIVRCYDDSSGTVDKSSYIDVEVLDAISFKIAGGEEVILNFPAKKCEPFIVDDTGHNLDKSPSSSSATRRSHVKHVKGPNGEELLVEVLDGIAFRDKRGEEWILKMPSKASAHYNVTKGSGDGSSTMRTHNEKISTDPTEHNPKSDYLTVERSDAISFRTINGREMILKMPSNDAGGNPGRADTYVWSPQNYDPTKDDPAPPENKDPNFYVKFVKGKSPLTEDELISQGPLWWIRKVSGNPWLVIKVFVTRENTGLSFEVKTLDSKDGSKLDDFAGYEFNDTPKQMPFDKSQKANFKPADLDLKKDRFLRGNINPEPTSGSPADFTSLIFLNLKGMGDGIECDLIFKGYEAAKGPVANIGYYVWAVSGGDAFTGVPIHPAPDASNALGPYPFDDAVVDTYIGLWNSWGNPLSVDLTRRFRLAGIAVPPAPDAGAFGWSTALGAQQFKDAINTLDEYDYEQALAAAASLPFHINVTPPTIFETLTIDFGNTPDKPPSLTADITAMKYTGRLNFPYETDNTLDFDPPVAPTDTKTKTITQARPSEDRTVKIKWSAKDGLSIT